jgi:hypothetical protein
MVTREQVTHAARTYSLRASHLLASLIFRRQIAKEFIADAAQIIADLQTEGVHVTSLERMLPHSGPRILASALKLLEQESVARSAAHWVRSTSSADLTAETLLARLPELYLMGLDDCVLGVVEQYLKLPVAYHGAVLRHSLVDGQSAGPRLWHQDAEDFHVFRMVVYLNDVSQGGGPFEYIPRSLGITYDDFQGRCADLTNDRMEEVVPREKWKRCFGPAGTVVLCDTAKVFHHESMQIARDRSVLMIGFSSRWPSGIEIAMGHFPVERVTPALKKLVPPAKFPHVFAWRRHAERHPTPLLSSPT